MVQRYGLTLTGLGCSSLTGFCERVNELSGATESYEILYQLSDC
jgi:hypothetical protein